MINAIDTPLYLALGGITKGIGLAFKDESLINRIGDIF